MQPEADGTSVVMGYNLPIYNRTFKSGGGYFPDALMFCKIVVETNNLKFHYWKEDAQGPCCHQGFYGRRSRRCGVNWDRVESFNLRGVKKLELRTNEAESTA